MSRRLSMPALTHSRDLTNQAPRKKTIVGGKRADADPSAHFLAFTLVLEDAHRLPNLCADEHQPITDGYLRP